MQGTLDGENFHLVLTFSYSSEWQARLAPSDAVALNDALAALRLKLKWRGQWSDCAYWRLSAHAHDIALPGREFEYRFERDSETDSGDWRALGAQ